MALRYRLEFKSDFHFGSGMGAPGVADNGMLRDEGGLPAVSGKTVKGMVRDAVECLLELRPPNASTKKEVLERLFGGEGGAAPSFRFGKPSILIDQRRRIGEDMEVISALGRTEYHTAVDRASGTALSGSLFSREVAPGCLVFEGAVEQILHLPEDIYEVCRAYLLCGMLFITHIGGSRRRGRGLAKFVITAIDGASENGEIKERLERAVAFVCGGGGNE